MSPEQVKGDSGKHDERTDIYSLCAFFYEFLTLQTYLKPRKTLDELLKAVLTDKPKLAMLVRNKYQSAVPADLSHFMARGLAKDPGQRFQSIREMQQVLQKVAEGHTPIQCPFTFSKRIINAVAHLVEKVPMVGLLFFMLLIMLAVSGAYFLITHLT
jgi:serine/threonine-protein kinase